ncbi:pleckstrin homology domain-containing family A member 4 isoform X2 [Vombatus ursinus]|uniref:pleckstrin homology domain-containing family A member 4 isoform X2 n=1 Tax=Vombatus ursinus TaxID=29139 RepID=UPI000FFD0745|nr:pleckstrin homology domain-containing family A member 4 isoform X2 [Vombatus ursinus]
MEEGRPRSSLSLASSVSTVSSLTLSSKPPRAVSGVRAFGKRGSSLRRDPNLPVHIRGWLHKQDSSGLRLWKRRWFVLSGHCLFYYKDSREERVLGSVPLPSYSVRPDGAGASRGRRYTFTVEHPGMRTYVLAADTVEDLRGWLRALGRATRAEGDDYGSQTPPAGPPAGEGPGGPGGPPEVGSSEEGRSAESLEVARISGRHRELTPSPPPGLVEPPQRSRQRARSPELFSPLFRPPSPLGLPRPRSAPAHRPSALVGGDTRPHTPLSRIDVRPLPEWAPASRTLSRPSTPRRAQPSETGALRPPRSPQHWATELRAKAVSGYLPLSPRPPGSRGSVASLPPPLPSGPGLDSPLHRSADTDALLTKLCGQDRLLRRLAEEVAKNQEEKERLEAALELTRRAVGEPGPGGRAWSRLRLLQDRLVGVRAALCHLAQERERVWNTYSGLEQELGTLRETLEDLLHLGPPQARVSAQQQLWMVEDTLAGLGDPNWGRPHGDGDGDGPGALPGPGSPSSPRAQSPDGQCSPSPAPSPSPPPPAGPKGPWELRVPVPSCSHLQASASRVRMSAQEQLERMRRHQEAGRLRLRPLSPGGVGPSAVRRQLEPGSERDAPLLDSMGLTGAPQQWTRSSGSWSSSRSPRSYIPAPEGQRERVLSLSQALATEASHWHKFITGRRSPEAAPDSASRLTPPPRSPPVGSPPPVGRGRGSPTSWAPTWGGAAPPDEGKWPLRVTLLQSSF